jgi:hypothetical protein
MPSDIKEAERMLAVYCSVGARSFVVTKTELEWPGHKKVKWGKNFPMDELRRKLPAMVRTAAVRRPLRLPDGETVMAGENLIVRPTGPGVALVQLDDLTAEQLDRIRPTSFVMHTTSPGSYQAWIAVSGVADSGEQFKEFVRRVRKAAGGNDASASHATRLAGTENWKLKNLPDPPIITLIHAAPGRVMTAEALQHMGLLSAPAPVRAYVFTRAQRRTAGAGSWPSYEKALAGAPLNRAGTGPSRSHADYWFCYRAQQWGWSMEETERKLLEVSPKARHQAEDGDPGYARVTAQNAAAAVARERQRSRGIE